MLSRSSRMMILGDWINEFSYAVFDGESMFLEQYIEGETSVSIRVYLYNKSLPDIVRQASHFI